MARYYSEDDILEMLRRLSKEPVYQHEDEDYYSGVYQVAGELCLLPEADVIEVVRCKDCKYHEYLDGGVQCQRMDGLLMTLPDDYCSYGRRKTY